MELILGVGGIVIGAVITWAVTHFYARKEERSLARLPEQIALTLIPQLVARGFIEASREDEAQVATQEVLSSWGTTQREMNEASFRDFKRADNELQSVYERFRTHIPPEERVLFDEAQEAWKAFREKDVRFAGALHKGGTVQPLIHNATALSLTRERLADLRQRYDHRRRITVPYEQPTSKPDTKSRS